ncbi:MAG: MliC family protein [Candidatus Paceibacterota bacterium]|jgi:membrane-bound inhibitor of C-type lysozyme
MILKKNVWGRGYRSGWKIQLVRIVLLILIIIGLVLIFTRGSWVPKVVNSIVQSEGLTGQVINATFVCEGNKSIGATFHNYQRGVSAVDLKLSDGREMTLSQAISASGARYASADESFVFWNKGDTAFITEQDQNTYTDCVVK